MNDFCVQIVCKLIKKRFSVFVEILDFLSRSGGNRTLDPMIKSHVLYQLSYGPKIGTKLHYFFEYKIKSKNFEQRCAVELVSIL